MSLYDCRCLFEEIIFSGSLHAAKKIDIFEVTKLNKLVRFDVGFFSVLFVWASKEIWFLCAALG